MSKDIVTISDLGRIVTGKTPSTNNSSFFDGAYQFVTPSDLDWKTYYCRMTERTVTDDARKSYLNQFIPGNAVMVTCIGNTIGKCGLSSEGCMTNQQINSIVPNNGIDPKFVYYLLVHNTDAIRAVGLGGGSATPILNKTSFSKIKLRVPPPHQWDNIANILSAYDDLIENNRRRIQLLEQAARLLYKEWFVHLRFPGHEHAKIIDGLPEGWERKRLGDVAVTNTASYKTNNLPREINYIDISSVNQGRIVTKNRMTSSEAPGRARRKGTDGDVIWSNVRPNLRAYALILDPEENDVFSTGFTILSPMIIPFSYLYLLVTTDEFVGHLVNHTTGASYPAVRSDDFERAEILLPTQQVLEMFHGKIEPAFRMIRLLEKEMKSLSQARDLLLPKLMSGEVAI